MSGIRIIAGLVSNMRPLSRASLSFQIGDPPEWLSIMGTTMAPPFNPNEYVALAVRGSTVLAYRDAGLGGPPRTVNPAPPMLALVLGLIPMAVIFDPPASDSPAWALLCFGVMAVTWAIYRLVGIAAAKRALATWQPSESDLAKR